MHYTKIHWGDYSRDTGHLTPTEHGLYLMMMRLYYTTERPLPKEGWKLFRSIGARTKETEAAALAVLEDFFTLEDDGWHQKRIDAEIAKYLAKASVNAENGKQGGRPKEPKENPNGFDSDPKVNPQITLTTNHKPLTNKNHQTGAKKAAPDGFLKFWSAWPKSSRKGAKGKCLDRWLSGTLEEDAEKIVAHVDAMKACGNWNEDRFIPAPLVYLNQSRWDGAEIAEPSQEQFI